MVRGLRNRLSRLGEGSPLRLASAYACVALPLSAVVRVGLVDERRVVVFAAVLLWVAASVGVVVIDAWYRDQSVVAAGVSAALTIGITNLAVRALVDIISKRSIRGAMGTFAIGFWPIAAGIGVLLPVCIALVWIARRATDPSPRDSGPASGR